MSAIGGDHGIVLEIRDHGDEDSPTFNILTDTNKSVTFTICDLDGLESCSHLFDFVLHFSEIHLGPLELEIVVESILTFFDMLPQFLHPSDFDLDCLDDLGTAVGLAFREFEHFFIIDEFIEGFLFGLNDFLEFSDSLEASFNSSIIIIERFSLQASLNLLEMLFEFFYSFFGFSSFNSLWTINLLLYFSSYKGNCLIVIHKLETLLHFVLFFLIVSLLVGL